MPGLLLAADVETELFTFCVDARLCTTGLMTALAAWLLTFASVPKLNLLLSDVGSTGEVKFLFTNDQLAGPMLLRTVEEFELSKENDVPELLSGDGEPELTEESEEPALL